MIGGRFKTTILSSKQILFEGNARSVFLPGVTGEFEILNFHKSIISLLKEGRIFIDWEKEILIREGLVKMHKNELVALVEEG